MTYRLRSPPTDAALLLVDDDELFRSLLSQILSEIGYPIHQAATAQAALIQAQTHPCELALLDIQLPDGSGLALARALHPLPVLFVTQHTEIGLVEAAFADEKIAASAVGYLVKPVDVATIGSTVIGALGVAHQLRSQQRLLEASTRAAEAEKRTIANALHDELGASLVQMRWQVAALKDINLPDAPRALVHAAAERLTADIDGVYDTVTNLIERLSPEAIDTLGLGGALAMLVQQWQTSHPRCTFTLAMPPDVFDGLDTERAVIVYRFVQEAFTNAVRHAEPTAVTLLVEASPMGCATLRVTDNGCGFVPGWPGPAGTELRSLRERASALRGELDVETAPGKGTVIRLSMGCSPSATGK